MIIIAMMAVPLAACVLMAALPSSKTPRGAYEAIHVLSVTVVLGLGLWTVWTVFLGGGDIEALGAWFHVDALGSIFISIVCTVGFLTGLCAVPQIRNDGAVGKLNPAQIKKFYAFFSLFMFTMLLVVLSNNIILMWASIEATTLSTVFLVGSYNTKVSLEAAWKYLIVCTTGVAFGLYGTLICYANAADVMADPHQAVFWSQLIGYAPQFDAALIQIAFVFIAIGFGTKAGLFPMHTWMPDAHSQSPSSVSGLLSGALVKCALLVLIRFYIIAVEAVGPRFPQTVMMILGVASIVYSAFALMFQDDLKRKLAYSTCENVGIVALCLGFGGVLGVAAALLHCLFHSLTKSLIFCLSGNVIMKYKTTDLKKVRGIIQVAPVTAVLMGGALFALSAFPPFALFFSEVLAFVAGIGAGYLWLIIPLGLVLTIVIAAFSLVFLRSVMGKAPEAMKKGDLGPGVLIPEFALMALILWFGIALPTPIVEGIQSATAIVLQQGPVDIPSAPALAHAQDMANDNRTTAE